MIKDSPFRVLRDPDAAVKFAEEQTRLLNKIRNDISSRASVREAFTTQVKKETAPVTELLEKQIPLLEAALTGTLPQTEEQIRAAGPKERTKIAKLLKKIKDGQALTRAEIVQLQKLQKKDTMAVPMTVNKLIKLREDIFEDLVDLVGYAKQERNKLDRDTLLDFYHAIYRLRLNLIYPDYINQADAIIEDAINKISSAWESDPNEVIQLANEYIVSEFVPELIDDIKFVKDVEAKTPGPLSQQKKSAAGYIPFVSADKGKTVTIKGSNFRLSGKAFANNILEEIDGKGDPVPNSILKDIKLTDGLRGLLTETNKKSISIGMHPDDLINFQRIMSLVDDKDRYLYQNLPENGAKYRLAVGPAGLSKDEQKKYIKDLQKFKFAPEVIGELFENAGMGEQGARAAYAQAVENLGMNIGQYHEKKLKEQGGNGLFTLGNPGHKRPNQHGRAMPSTNRCGTLAQVSSAARHMRGGCQQAPPAIYFQPQGVADRVGLLAGAIDAGNNAPQIKNELAMLLDMMARNRWINHDQYGNAIRKYFGPMKTFES